MRGSGFCCVLHRRATCCDFSGSGHNDRRSWKKRRLVEKLKHKSPSVALPKGRVLTCVGNSSFIEIYHSWWSCPDPPKHRNSCLTLQEQSSPYARLPLLLWVCFMSLFFGKNGNRFELWCLGVASNKVPLPL